MVSAVNSKAKTEYWDPKSVDPKALFRNPDLSLLCARKIEGQFYERKSKREPKEIASTICAFANSNRQHGGLLAVGISDDGEIDGVHNRQDINLNRILEYHYSTGTPTKRKFVACRNRNGQDDQILLIYVPYLEGRVAETSDGTAYERVGDETKRLRDKEKRELEYSKGQISFEDEIACEFSEDITVKEIIEELHKAIVSAGKASADVSTEELLLCRHLLKKDNGKLYLTKAGLLLFGKDPKSLLPGAYVRFVRYSGTERKTGVQHNVVKDEVFSDPLPRLILRLRDFVRSQMREFTFMGPEGKFLKEPEYPEDVWLEALVNALAHRSYSLSNTPIFVNMYDDRFEVHSPGDYPTGVHPREFIHNPQNPHLMEALWHLRFVMMLREGSKRMRQSMERFNLPEPEFSLPGNPYVRIVLRNDIERRLKARTEGGDSIPQVSNLFRITWRLVDNTEEVSEEDARVPETKEIREAFVKSLKAHDYAVDSFFGDNVAETSKEFKIPNLKESGVASVFPGFKFRIRQLSNGVYLVIDYTTHVRNRLTLDRLLKIHPKLKDRQFSRGFAFINSTWEPCKIVGIDPSGSVTVELWGKRNESTVLHANEVLPMLPTTWISETLAKAKVDVDLQQTIKSLSLNLTPNAARERYSKTSEIASDLSKNVFPIRIGNYRLFLSDISEPLRPPGMMIKSDIFDPVPLFSRDSEGRAKTVINGLSTYGSYEKPGLEIPLVLLCPSSKTRQMKSLVDLLQKGRARYRGFEKTFAVSFTEPIISEVESLKEYANKCRQICASIPRQSFFLVYCPEKMYSRSDYKSPYYQVKHFLLEAGFPSQMIDEDTLNDPSWKDYNLSLDIFAKAGYVPWVLSEGLPDADLFLGLSYSSIQMPGGIVRLIGYVNVFDKYGRWLYYKGNTQPIEFDKRDEAFRDILTDVAREYQKKAKLQRLHVHHGFKLSRKGREEIASGVKSEARDAEISFVYVNKHTPLRLYDTRPEGDGTLARGNYVVSAPNQFTIATTGQNDFSQKGLGTPKPLEVSINRVRSKGNLDLRIYAQHVLSLTRLNWASTKDFCREPITLKFASDIAYLMNVFLRSFGEFKLHPSLERTPWFL